MKERTAHPAVVTGRRIRQRNVALLGAPIEPEYRGPFDVLPLPAGSIHDQFAEMFANDDEAIAWRDAERRADVAARGPR